jgi:methylglutaconyl-CoA hydratase
MVMALLRRAVGEKMALDLVLTGRVLTAGESLAVGLVSRVVPEDDLEREGLDLARELARTSASALAFTKQLFYQLDGESLGEGIARGARVNALARGTPDFRDAVARFLGK